MTSDFYSLLGIASDSTLSAIKQAAQIKLDELKNAYAVLASEEKRAAYDSTVRPGRDNYYNLLGLPPEASEAAVKHATQQQINQIKQAFNVLSDAHKRKAYDAELKAQLEVTQTDTGSFKIKPKERKPHNAHGGFEQVAGASQQALQDINPYDAPDADMEDLEEADYVLANRSTRLGASMLDGLVFLIPIVIVSIVIVLLFGVDGLQNLGQGDASAVMDSTMSIFFISIGIGYLVVIGVNLTWLSRYGQTIGKRMVGIKIVRTDGSRCGLGRIIFHRSLSIQLLTLIPILGAFIPLIDILFIFQQSRRCLHDLIADTVVVRA